MMTNDEIKTDVATIAGAVAKLMATPATKDEVQEAFAELTGAALGLLANSLQNLNDIARYCRANTPAGTL